MLRSKHAAQGAVCVAIWLLMAGCVRAASTNGVSADRVPADWNAAAHARKNFSEAQNRYKKDPQTPKAAWEFGRTCFDLAEFAENSSERAELAEQGIAACKQVIAADQNSGPGHYYLGMNLGQLARTRGLGALKIVDEMEREFTLATKYDEHFDYAGPDRNLGLLYREAPSVGSIGSRSKARQHLQRAVELAPDYPENHLNLIESYLQWGDRKGAVRQWKALQETWPASREKLTGSDWIGSWISWDQRRKDLKKRVEDPPKALESPRHAD